MRIVDLHFGRIWIAGAIVLMMTGAIGSGLLGALPDEGAEPAVLIYDFEILTDGALNGQDGWLTVKTGNSNDSQRHRVESGLSSPSGYDRSRAVTYRFEGGGVGGRATRVNDATFSAMTLRPSGVTVIEIEMHRTYWGSSLRLGRDANNDRDLDNGEVGLAVRTRLEGTNRSTLQVGSVSTGSTMAIGDYNNYQVAVDRTRERASLWVRDLSATPTGDWTAVTGIQDVATGFTTVGAATDPTTWNAWGLQSEGNLGFFDNLRFRWVDVSTRAVDFGDRRDGSTASAIVTVLGEYLTGALRAEIIGDAAGEFTFADGSALVPVVQAGTELDLIYTPLTKGDRTATLRIQGPDMLAPLDVELTANGPIYVDDTFDGGGWQLVAYGDNGVLPGPLTAAAGTYDPLVRSGGAVLGDALARVTASAQMAITWAQSGTPSGGLSSYTNGLWFTLPTPEAMTLTGVKPGANDAGFTPVSVSAVHGPWGGPSAMFLRADTFGANYGDSYGLVGSSTAGNPAVDWGPDAQDRAVVYLHPGRQRQSGATYERVYVTPSGTANGFVPSQMAVWVRNAAPAPQISGITSGDGALRVDFTLPSGIYGQIRDIEYRLNGGAWTARTPTSSMSPLIITGRAVGSAVDVEIRAVNAVGPGAASLPMSGTVRLEIVAETEPAANPAAITEEIRGVIVSPAASSLARPVRSGLPGGETGVRRVGGDDGEVTREVIDNRVVLRAGSFEALLAVLDEAGERLPADRDGTITVGRGGVVEAVVRGLPPSAEGQLVVMSTPVVIGTFTSDGLGRLEGTALLPPDLLPGVHTLWLLMDEIEISVGLRVAELVESAPVAPETRLPSTGHQVGVEVWAIVFVALGGLGLLLARRSLVLRPGESGDHGSKVTA